MRERNKKKEREKGEERKERGRKGGGEEDRNAPFSKAEASGLPENVVMVRNFLSRMKCIQTY